MKTFDYAIAKFEVNVCGEWKDMEMISICEMLTDAFHWSSSDMASKFELYFPFVRIKDAPSTGYDIAVSYVTL